MPARVPKHPRGIPFWDRVQKSEGCWNWTGGKSTGYGVFWIKNTSVKAHRIAYEELVGPIPPNLTLDHLCRNRACVNPSHLEPVTLKVNVLRGNGMGAQCAQKTHCLYGHRFDERNTRLYTRPNGILERICRTCEQLRHRSS